MSEDTTPSPIPLTRSPRTGLYGGQVSSKRAKAAAVGATEEKKAKKPPSLRLALRDAAELIKARRGRLALGILLMLISRMAGLVLPGTTKFLLDDVIGKSNRELLLPLVLTAIAATMIQATTSFSLSQLLGKAAQRSITDMRRKIQRHVGRLTVAYYDQTKSGTLLSRVMNDADGLRNLVGSGLVDLIGGMVTAVFALAILITLNGRLTALVLGILSLFAVVMFLAFSTLRPLFRERSKINAEVSGRLSETLSGARVVKAYGAERREALVFAKGIHLLFRNVAKTITGMSAIGTVSTLLIGLASVLIMWVGGNDVLSGRMSVGSFFSFTLYLGLLVGPIAQIVSIGSQLTEAFAGLERIREILGEKREDQGDDRRLPLGKVEGRVEFEHVGFEYKEGAPVLHDVSFVAEPGTSTALVGHSGSGKSTMIGLVAAFHKPTEGNIRVDGRNLGEIRLADYRSQLGVVFQDIFLFDGTVLENIAYAQPDATREEILRAGQIAHCEEFVTRLPEGWATVVGERGIKLSGGERQRVAIARAILADPRILILDEATSSLDSESEFLIQQGLAELMRGRTTFVIAHRLSTIRRADTILVLEAGRVIERGKHQELLALNGRYHALYSRQYDLEANLFRNPGETEEAKEADEPKPAPAGARGMSLSMRTD